MFRKDFRYISATASTQTEERKENFHCFCNNESIGWLRLNTILCLYGRGRSTPVNQCIMILSVTISRQKITNQLIYHF